MSDTLQVAARLGTALPDVGESCIQWMPPGLHTVWPDGFEKPFSVRVTPQIAATANAQLQELRSKAAAGKGNWPYGDFDHQDREQSFEPLEFFWGGDDPKGGGVRLRVKWSAPGEQAVQGKAFRSFSPRWRLDKRTNAFLGIGLNVGGLVNRSAFQTIEALAKAEIKTSPNGAGDSGREEDRARMRSKLKSLDPTLVRKLVARANQKDMLVEDYLQWLLSGILTGRELQDQKLADLLEAVSSDDIHRHNAGFIVQARQYGAIHGITDECDAQLRFSSTAEGRAAYALYSGHPAAPLNYGPQSASASGTHAFLCGTMLFASARGIEDLLDAQEAFASTTEGSRLYQAYRDSL